jgi:hypothetical protein
MDRKLRAHRGVDLPVFEETIKAYQSLQFLRDDQGRWTELEIKAGWYQDADGNLYQYDGVIWDEVPKDRVEKLEYLG